MVSAGVALAGTLIATAVSMLAVANKKCKENQNKKDGGNK